MSAIRPLKDEERLFDAINTMKIHPKLCTVFRGYVISESYHNQGDLSWEAKVTCNCAREFRIWDTGYGRVQKFQSLEEYCQASCLFSSSIRDKAIQSQVPPEQIFCPILGISYENQTLEEIDFEEADVFFIEME